MNHHKNRVEDYLYTKPFSIIKRVVHRSALLVAVNTHDIGNYNIPNFQSKSLI